MDEVVEALAGQQAELAGVLDSLGPSAWRAPTRCPGWDVADVVLHLVQTDALALASATGRFADAAAGWGDPVDRAGSVDAAAAAAVAAGRGAPGPELRDRWSSGAGALLDAFAGMDLSTRVPWVAGALSARTLAATRLAETWIHAGDVAHAVGRVLAPSDRLRFVARLAWRTLPYAFASVGRSLAGPVAFHLMAPGGGRWDFAPGEPARTVVSGPAAELCEVAARRIDAAGTSLTARGPDAAAVLALVRTYA